MERENGGSTAATKPIVSRQENGPDPALGAECRGVAPGDAEPADEDDEKELARVQAKFREGTE